MNLSQQWGFIAAIVFNALLNPDLVLAQEVYKAPGIQITTTEFDDTALIFAEPDSMNLGDGLGKEWQLNSVVTKKTGDAMHLLRFSTGYLSHTAANWNKATTSDAETLKVLIVGAKKGPCNSAGICYFSEIVAAVIPTSLLYKSSSEAIRVRFTSESGDKFVISINQSKSKNLYATSAAFSIITSMPTR